MLPAVARIDSSAARLPGGVALKREERVGGRARGQICQLVNKTKSVLRYKTTSVTYCEDLLFVEHQVHRNSSDLVFLLA